MKSYNYFKFFTKEWLAGRISGRQVKSCMRGAFIDICALYWEKEGIITSKDALVYVEKEEFEFLIEHDFIKKTDNDRLLIPFLSEQLIQKESITIKRSTAGTISSIKKKETEKEQLFNKSQQVLSILDHLLQEEITKDNEESHFALVNKNTQKIQHLLSKMQQVLKNETKNEEKISEFQQVLNKFQQMLEKLQQTCNKNQQCTLYISSFFNIHYSGIKEKIIFAEELFFALEEKIAKIDNTAKFKETPGLSKSLKKLNTENKINLSEIEEKYFPGRGIAFTVQQFHLYFQSLGYKFQSDNATRKCFLGWISDLAIETKTKARDKNSLPTPKSTPELETSMAEFSILEGVHEQIRRFVGQSKGKERKALITQLIDKYGLEKSVRKMFSYFYYHNQAAEHYNTVEQFQETEDRIKQFTDAEWEEMKIAREIKFKK